MSPTVFDFPALFNAVLKYGNFMTVPTLMTRRETLDAVGVFNYEPFQSATAVVGSGPGWCPLSDQQSLAVLGITLYHRQGDLWYIPLFNQSSRIRM